MRPHPLIYEINARVWIAELSEKYGQPIKLGSLPVDEWERLKELGFDYIWLMGIWEPGGESKRIAAIMPGLRHEYDEALPDWTGEDIIGSPYSVKGYKINPLLGTWDDVDLIREHLYRLDMGLILDFVPNHTAIDHPWTTDHPEYYVRGSKESVEKYPHDYFLVEKENTEFWIAHGRDPYFPPWTDTAQLNYFNPDTRARMIGTLQEIAEHCDGVRCDMAMLVMNDIHVLVWQTALRESGFPRPRSEFWTEVIQSVKSTFPGFVFVGEVYWDLEWRLQQLGFDYVYDKKLYDRLKGSIVGDVRGHLMGEIDYQNKLVRFIENHDEKRAVTAFGKEKSRAAAVLVATLPGMKLFHQGQMEGTAVKLPVQLARAVKEPVDNDLLGFYTNLLKISKYPVFHYGDWKLLEIRAAWDGNWTHMNLIAYQWYSELKTVTVVVNLSGRNAQGYISISVVQGVSNDLELYDELNSMQYIRNRSDLMKQGLYIDLTPYSAHIFTLS